MSNSKPTSPAPQRKRTVEFSPNEAPHTVITIEPAIPKKTGGLHADTKETTRTQPEGRSIGITAKLSNGSDKRTRIDNLGGYHEYKSYPERAMAEDAVLRSLNVCMRNQSSTSSVLSLPTPTPRSARNSLPTQKESKSFINDIRGFIPDGPTSIAPLVTTSHVFIRDRCCLRRTPQEYPPEVLNERGQCLREVINESNRRMFFIKQTRSTPWWSFILLIGLVQQKFGFTLYDKLGKPAIKVTGSQILFGVYSIANIKYPDGTLIAYIKQSICDGAYKIYDDKDRVIFTLVGPVFACYAPCVFCCCDEEFEILFSGSADEVGRMGRYWGKDEFPDIHPYFGVSFPQSMAVRSKVVILGASICIRYQYFVKLGNGIVLLPLYLTILFLVFFLYFNCFGFCNLLGKSKIHP